MCFHFCPQLQHCVLHSDVHRPDRGHGDLLRADRVRSLGKGDHQRERVQRSRAREETHVEEKGKKRVWELLCIVLFRKKTETYVEEKGKTKVHQLLFLLFCCIKKKFMSKRK